MKNLARGSVFFGLFALLGFMFYLQPTVVAEGTFSIANDSQENIQIEQFQLNNNLEHQEQDNFINDLTNYSKNNNFKFSETRTFKATAYCLRGRTASGGSVRRGIVAADRRVLPLGTRIQLSAGAYSGTYVVADTGGAVRGNTIDIWVSSCAEANRFGRRTVGVRVIQ